MLVSVCAVETRLESIVMHNVELCALFICRCICWIMLYYCV